MIKIFYWIHQYSLDVAVSAVVILLVLSRSFHLAITTPHSILLSTLLFFSVLFIYHLDHLLDQLKINKKHCLKWNNRCTSHLSVIAVTAMVNLLILALYPVSYQLAVSHSNLWNIQVTGIILLGLVFIYLLSIYFLEKKIFFLKEILVSFLFSLGVFLPFLIQQNITSNYLEISLSFKQTFINLWLVVFHNSIIYSYFSRSKDYVNQQPSIWTLKFLSQEVKDKIISLIGLMILITLLTTNLKEEFIPQIWTVYLLVLLILQQLIFNLGKNQNHQLKMLYLDSVFILGVFLLF